MRKGFVLTLVLLILLVGVGYNIYQMDDREVMVISSENDSSQVLLINDEKTYRNSNFKRDYIELHILDDNRLMINAKTIRAYDSYMVDIYEYGSKEELFRDERTLKDGKLDFNKKYDLEDGKYEIKVFYGNKTITHDGWYVNYRGELETLIQVEEGSYKFPVTDVYLTNKGFLSENNNVKKRYKSLILFSSQDQLRLRNLVEEIVGDEEDDYEKAFLISDWVSSNIYYDYDALKKGEYDISKTMDTLNARRSVCQGYANLTQSLMRAGDIPCRKTIGYALGGSGIKDEKWEDIELDQANHVWNEVYVDGRWVLIDTTWNSTNRYEDGKFEKDDSTYAYFDMTLENFSDKHRITER